MMEKSKKWLLYLDANNLYGWAMSQYLPTGGFKWLSTKPLEATSLLVQKILSLKENSNRGCRLEVKLSIPKELHSKFRDYPMCPERKKVPYDWYSSKQKEWAGKQRSDSEKFILTLYDKDHYVIHYRNLQQCIKEGYVLEKVYRILGFEQSPLYSNEYSATCKKQKMHSKKTF